MHHTVSSIWDDVFGILDGVFSIWNNVVGIWNCVFGVSSVFGTVFLAQMAQNHKNPMLVQFGPIFP